MQKRTIGNDYIHIPLDEQPLYFFPYTQRYKTTRNMHYHNGMEIGLCLKGEGVFFVEDRLFVFGQGDVSVVPAGKRHIAQSPDRSPSQWYFLTVDPDALGLQLPGQFQSYILSERSVTSAMQLLFAELEAGKKGCEQAVKLLLELLCIWLRREHAAAGTTQPAETSAQILPALAYMAQNYMEPVTVEQLAEMCYLSTPYFRKIFRSNMRMSPIAYLQQVRLKMADVLLRSTDLPIALVAERSGFRTLSSFNRQFRAAHGVSPRQWRNSV